MRNPTLILAAASALMACGPRPPPEATRCYEDTGIEQPAATDGGRSVIVGSGTSDAFTPWTDGIELELIRGFQGGLMITPSLQIPALDGESHTEHCWRTRMLGTALPAEPPFPADEPTDYPGAEYTFQRHGDHYYLENYYLELGELYGQDVNVTVEVYGQEFTLVRQARVKIAGE